MCNDDDLGGRRSRIFVLSCGVSLCLQDKGRHTDGERVIKDGVWAKKIYDKGERRGWETKKSGVN